MSNEAVHWAYRQKCPSPGAKFVLVTLCDFADETGYCYPSQKKLSAMTQQGERTVRLHLAALERVGLIRRERRFNADGTYKSDGFYIQRQNLPLAETADGKSCRRQKTVQPAAESATIQRQNLPPNHQDKPLREPSLRSRESEINSPAPARAREASFPAVNFSPAHARLTESEIAADAAECNTTAAIFAGYIAQWADKRKTRGGTSADWRADLRSFVRAAIEVAARGPTGQQSGGARASPLPFAARDIQTSRESIEKVLAAKREFEHGRAEFSGRDDGTERRLSARVRADAGDDGGVAETPRRS